MSHITITLSDLNRFIFHKTLQDLSDYRDFTEQHQFDCADVKQSLEAIRDLSYDIGKEDTTGNKLCYCYYKVDFDHYDRKVHGWLAKLPHSSRIIHLRNKAARLKVSRLTVLYYSEEKHLTLNITFNFDDTHPDNVKKLKYNRKSK